MATRGRKSQIGKAVGRNASELRSSLVTTYEDADPVVRRGRPMSQILITESVCVIFLCSGDGMLWKIFNPVLETRYGDVREH